MYCMADTRRCHLHYWLLLLSVLWVISLVGHFAVDAAHFTVSDDAASPYGGLMPTKTPQLIYRDPLLLPGWMMDLRVQDWSPPIPLRPPIAC
jgi:hypothetical protein